jgi:hypothetical protein
MSRSALSLQTETKARHMRRDKESVDESPQLASFAEEPAPRLPRGAPQRPCLRHQQDTTPVQGTPGLNPVFWHL